MARRADPRQIAKLAQVQHVRKAAAEASLAWARDAEANALETRHCAERDAVSAASDWLECLSEPRFEPERARDLAAWLVVRQTAQHEAVAMHEEASEGHSRRQADWRMSAARVELADAMVKHANRASSRMREERRLAALFDRVTFAWTRR